MLLVLDDGDVHGYAVISEPGGMIRVAELQIIYPSECLPETEAYRIYMVLWYDICRIDILIWFVPMTRLSISAFG